MTYPRSTLISLESTPWYHCVCRCVRRPFLCGKDNQSGMDFNHRQGWIAERIMELAAIFSIDVTACSVMSNHYHIILRVDKNRALSWSDHEVFTRWIQLFTGPDVVRRYLAVTGNLRKPRNTDSSSSEPSTQPSDTSPDIPPAKPRASLAPFDNLTDISFAIPFGFHEYAELVDWTGRQLRRKKRSIREKTPPILKRLGVDAALFVSSMDTLLEQFGTAVGDPEVLRMHCKLRGLRSVPGIRCDVFFDAA